MHAEGALGLGETCSVQRRRLAGHQRQRSDFFDTTTFPDTLGGASTRYVNVSITSVGPWTAPSLSEFVIKCRPKSPEKPDFLARDNYDWGGRPAADKASQEDDNVEDVFAGPFEPVRTMLSQLASSASWAAPRPGPLGYRHSRILDQQDQEGMRQDHQAAMQSFALHILVSEGGAVARSVPATKEDVASASDPSVAAAAAAAAPRTPMVNMWSSEDAESGSFLALASYHDNGGQHPRKELEKLLDPDAVSGSLPPGSCMSAAALYRHEAYLAVGGASEGSKHPVPLQPLQLSTARNDEIDRHRDSGGDEGQYQQTQVGLV